MNNKPQMLEFDDVHERLAWLGIDRGVRSTRSYIAALGPVKIGSRISREGGGGVIHKYSVMLPWAIAAAYYSTANGVGLHTQSELLKPFRESADTMIDPGDDHVRRVEDLTCYLFMMSYARGFRLDKLAELIEANRQLLDSSSISRQDFENLLREYAKRRGDLDAWWFGTRVFTPNDYEQVTPEDKDELTETYLISTLHHFGLSDYGTTAGPESPGWKGDAEPT